MKSTHVQGRDRAPRRPGDGGLGTPRCQAFADLFADEFIVNDVAVPEPITTKDGVREYAQGWFTAFPDMSVKQTTG